MTRQAAKLRRLLSHWEFLPYWLFYAPVYAHLIARGVTSGRFAGFACANPAIPFGGLLEYSKWELLSQLPSRYVPTTVVVPLECGDTVAQHRAEEAGIGYPLIAKPDRGERGLLVEKASGPEDLSRYLANSRAFARAMRQAGVDPSDERVLLQAVAPGRLEFGVLYVRFPRESGGRITSIVQKDFLSVTGDGSRTIAELISDGERSRLFAPELFARPSIKLDRVPDNGEQVVLEEIGNHSRGTTFLNANHLVSSQLARVFDGLAAGMHGFNIGRFDIRCDSVDALASGEFQVVEVNGVNSEPAHIYDPSNSITSALRDLLKHWRLVNAVATANRLQGCVPPTAAELFTAIGRHARRRKLARSAAL